MSPLKTLITKLWSKAQYFLSVEEPPEWLHRFYWTWFDQLKASSICWVGPILPEKSDALLGKLKTDREGLKKEFSQLLSAAGQKATPVAVEQKVAALERAKSTIRSDGFH